MSEREVRRHVAYFSDREIALPEHALVAYSLVIRIQTGAANTEADDNARVASLVQMHHNCTCQLPIEHRKVV